MEFAIRPRFDSTSSPKSRTAFSAATIEAWHILLRTSAENRIGARCIAADLPCPKLQTARNLRVIACGEERNCSDPRAACSLLEPTIGQCSMSGIFTSRAHGAIESSE
jgi:hypothetical protein